jgi:hypothetical protein
MMFSAGTRGTYSRTISRNDSFVSTRVRSDATSGSVVLVESEDNVVYAEGTDVVLYGVSDLVVVVRAGLTLVTTKESSADLKTLIASLPPAMRDRE